MNCVIRALILAICTLGTQAFAAIEQNKTPARAGLRPVTNTAYFSIVEPMSQTCYANVIWITLDSAGIGKVAYATILAAQLTGKKLGYLEYSVDANGVCTLVQAELAS